MVCGAWCVVHDVGVVHGVGVWCRFVVATVRAKLYVWELEGGALVKTLDAHFGRIMTLRFFFQRFLKFSLISI